MKNSKIIKTSIWFVVTCLLVMLLVLSPSENKKSTLDNVDEVELKVPEKVLTLIIKKISYSEETRESDRVCRLVIDITANTKDMKDVYITDEFCHLVIGDEPEYAVEWGIYPGFTFRSERKSNMNGYQTAQQSLVHSVKSTAPSRDGRNFMISHGSTETFTLDFKISKIAGPSFFYQMKFEDVLYSYSPKGKLNKQPMVDSETGDSFETSMMYID